MRRILKEAHNTALQKSISLTVAHDDVMQYASEERVLQFYLAQADFNEARDRCIRIAQSIVRLEEENEEPSDDD